MLHTVHAVKVQYTGFIVEQRVEYDGSYVLIILEIIEPRYDQLIHKQFIPHMKNIFGSMWTISKTEAQNLTTMFKNMMPNMVKPNYVILSTYKTCYI